MSWTIHALFTPVCQGPFTTQCPQAMVHIIHQNYHKSQHQTKHLQELLKDKFSILYVTVDVCGVVSRQGSARHNRENFPTMSYSHNLFHIFFKSQACISFIVENLRPKTKTLLTVMLSWVLLTYELLLGCPALRAVFLLFSKLHQNVCLKGLRIFNFW